jgi:hypothetical protein
MNASQYSYGVVWDYLKARGWQIVPTKLALGTAAADGRNKKILMKPSAYAAPNRRVREYVIPHEMWHAVHYEEMGWECDELRIARNLNWKSAIEVVADGACLHTKPSRLMRTWVTASVVWHGKVGYRYSMADVRSQSAIDVVEQLVKAVNYWRDFSREGQNLPK